MASSTRYLLVENQRCLRFDDMFLASYPRSGNTWMRLLLSDLILQKHGFDTGAKLPIPANRIISGMHRDRIEDLDSRIQLPHRVFKTHLVYNKIGRKLVRSFWKPKAIYLFRNPADSLCSFYHFNLREAEKNGLDTNNSPTTSIEEFCLIKVERWCEHLESYIKAKKNNKQKLLFISYESMHSNLIPILQKAMNFLGISVDEIMCKKAIENHRFENKNPLSPSFFRKGKIGSSKEELPPETISLIEEKAIQIYNEARKLEDSNLQKV